MEEIGPRIRLYGEALAFVKGKARFSSLAGQAVEYFPSVFLKAALVEELESPSVA